MRRGFEMAPVHPRVWVFECMDPLGRSIVVESERWALSAHFSRCCAGVTLVGRLNGV